MDFSALPVLSSFMDGQSIIIRCMKRQYTGRVNIMPQCPVILGVQWIDGDGMMLHVAERFLAQDEARGESWRRSYYMPAPADRYLGPNCI